MAGRPEEVRQHDGFRPGDVGDAVTVQPTVESAKWQWLDPGNHPAREHAEGWLYTVRAPRGSEVAWADVIGWTPLDRDGYAVARFERNPDARH